MTKAIIFDLDSCLAAADEVGEQLFAPAFAAIRAANDGSVPDEQLRAAFAECWRVAGRGLGGVQGKWSMTIRSVNAFDAVGVHVHQLVRFEQSFHLRPNPRQ